MQNDIVCFGNDAFELDMLTGVIARHAFEVVYERLLAVGNTGVMLDVGAAGIARDRISWPALIECQIVESDNIPLVPVQIGHGCSPPRRSQYAKNNVGGDAAAIHPVFTLGQA